MSRVSEEYDLSSTPTLLEFCHPGRAFSLLDLHRLGRSGGRSFRCRNYSPGMDNVGCVAGGVCYHRLFTQAGFWGSRVNEIHGIQLVKVQ